MNYSLLLFDILGAIFGILNLTIIKGVIAILFFTGLILMITNNKRFVNEDIPITKNQKLIFIALTFVITFLNIGFYTYAYYKANNPDYAYNKIIKGVNFHVYRSNYMPNNYEQLSKFVLRDDPVYNHRNYVKYIVGYTEEKKIRDKTSSIIIVDQLKIDYSPTIDNLKKDIGETNFFPNYSEVKINKWPNSPAILEKTNNNHFRINTITPDNVRVVLATTTADSKELFKILESME